jgi:Flp pilus assembly protein TadD
MICLAGLVAAGIARWYGRAADDERRVIFAGTTAAIIALTCMSFKYAACWVNEDALWSHTLTHNDNAWQAHNRLGARKLDRGQVENTGPANRVQNLGAFHHFRRATALRPDLGETHNNLATAYREKARIFEQRGDSATAQRDIDASIEHFAEACRLTPQVPIFHVNLANALATCGRYVEAANKYKEILDGDPNNASMINNYGFALYKQGNKKEEAIAQFRRALELVPDLRDARESLAVALGEIPDPAASSPLSKPDPAAPPSKPDPAAAPSEPDPATPPSEPDSASVPPKPDSTSVPAKPDPAPVPVRPGPARGGATGPAK